MLKKQNVFELSTTLNDIVAITFVGKSDYGELVSELVLIPLQLYLYKKNKVEEMKNFYRKLNISIIVSPSYNQFKQIMENCPDDNDFSEIVAHELGTMKRDIDEFTENFLVKFEQENKILSFKEKDLLNILKTFDNNAILNLVHNQKLINYIKEHGL